MPSTSTDIACTAGLHAAYSLDFPADDTPTTPEINVHGIAIDGRYAYIASGAGVQAVNISAPKNAATFKVNGSYGPLNFTANGTRISDDGKFLFVSANAGIHMLDIAAPDMALPLVTRLTGLGIVEAMYLKSPFLYATSNDSGVNHLRVIDTTNALVLPGIITDYYIGNDDGDSQANNADNCRSVTNQIQTNDDEDSKGNACDNCNDISNEDQADLDNDEKGDLCDDDDDGDGHLDVLTGTTAADNCPRVANPAQTDTDNDGEGDVCDSDSNSDEDDHNDNVDNCPAVTNDDQANGYSENDDSPCLISTEADSTCPLDPQGDACDNSDRDELNDNEDKCPLDAEDRCASDFCFPVMGDNATAVVCL